MKHILCFNINNRSISIAVKEKNPRLTRRALLLKNINDTLKKKCGCRRRCMAKLDVNTLGLCRQIFWSKCADSRKQWLFDKLLESKNTKKGRLFMVEGGQMVCEKALRLLYKMPKNFFTAVKRKFNKGRCAPGSEGMRRKRHGVAYEEAVEWLEGYATSHGDRMPDSPYIKLEYKTRKLHVYNRYRRERVENLKPTINKITWYKLWREEMNHVRIKKVSKIQCVTCSMHFLLQAICNQNTYVFCTCHDHIAK